MNAYEWGCSILQNYINTRVWNVPHPPCQEIHFSIYRGNPARQLISTTKDPVTRPYFTSFYVTVVLHASSSHCFINCDRKQHICKSTPPACTKVSEYAYVRMRKCIIFMTVAKADRRERKQVSKPHEADTLVESSGLSVNVCENVIDS
jgi:hypothetical protein